MPPLILYVHGQDLQYFTESTTTRFYPDILLIRLTSNICQPSASQPANESNRIDLDAVTARCNILYNSPEHVCTNRQLTGKILADYIPRVYCM